MKANRLIAISGGIGSGKSVVCHMLSALGYKVYDCDSRARRIMDTDDDIKRLIVEEIRPDVVTASGDIDRELLSEIVFSDEKALNSLNRIVHRAVREDLKIWCREMNESLLFVETAILYQSELDKMVDEVWFVDAPPELRLKRVMNRSGLSAGQIQSRIRSQDCYEITNPHPIIYRINNDGVDPLLPVVERLLEKALRHVI